MKPQLGSLGASPLPPSSRHQRRSGLPLRGRSDELLRLQAAVGRGRRIVTITGPGGVGKTSLTRAFIESLHADAASRFVDLSAVKSAREGVERVEEVLAHLGAQDAFVVLDHVDAFVADAATLLAGWRARGRAVTFLMTSRERLRLSDEYVIALEPLPTESVGDAPSAALEMLLDRTDGFRTEAWSEEELAAMAVITQRVEGLPLAIVHCACRLRHVSPVRLVDELDQGLAVSVDAPRDLPARHATLTSTLDSSWALLDVELRDVLASLSVFGGGIDPARVQAIVGPHVEARTALEALCDRSLVRRLAGRDDQRYDLLGFVRSYAADRLAESGRAPEIRARHARAFLALGSEVSSSWYATADAPRATRDVEVENLMAAFDAAVDGAAPIADLVRSLPRITTAIVSAEAWTEWRPRLELLTRLLDHDADRARSKFSAGVLARAAGAYAQAELDFAESAELATDPADADLRAAAACLRALCRCSLRRPEGLIAMLDEAITTVGDRGLRVRAERARTIALAQVAHFEEATSAARAMLANAESNESLLVLGETLAMAGEANEAKQALSRVIEREREVDGVSVASKRLIVDALDSLCRLALERELHEQAVAYAGEGLALLDYAAHPTRFARALARHGVALDLAGDLEGAAQKFDRAIATLKQAGIVDDIALYRAHYAAIAARRGWYVEAAASFTALESAAVPPEVAAAIAPLRAVLRIAQEGREALASARTVVDLARRDEARFGSYAHEIRMSRTIAARALDDVRSGGGAQPLEVAPDGSWFRIGESAIVTLANRPGLARILRALAFSAPLAVSSDDLLVAGWPGERMVRDAGLVRLRVAIATLRRAGLDQHIITFKTPGGARYSLVGAIRVRADEPLDVSA